MIKDVMLSKININFQYDTKIIIDILPNTNEKTLFKYFINNILTMQFNENNNASLKIIDLNEKVKDNEDIFYIFLIYIENILENNKNFNSEKIKKIDFFITLLLSTKYKGNNNILNDFDNIKRSLKM